ncbi:unnamed protein product [Alternaria alternata]
MSFQGSHPTGKQDVFRFIASLVWPITLVCTIVLLGATELHDKNLNIFAIAFLAANVTWVVTLEIAVRSSRSGKCLFKAYIRPAFHTSTSSLGPTCNVYSPLIGDAIRLLHILPSTNETLGLEADLVHFPLLSAQLKNYKALSYTWGEEKASVSIAINGVSMLIRPNLDKILRKLRALEYEYIWVSPGGSKIFSSSRVHSKFRLMLFAQISKTTQNVIRMRAICSGAQSIIVATETGASTAADRIIQILDSVGKASYPISHATIVADTSYAADTLNDELTFSALEAFFKDPYWKRIWILQEFAIGNNTEFLIGDRTIAVTKLRTLLNKLYTQSSVQDRWNQVYTVFKIRRDWQGEVSLKLLLLLEITQGSLCGVRHDRIFALLGLSVDTLNSPVILRKRPDAKYEVVGDAIVTGAMQGELWEKLRSEHVQDIEVV